MRQLTGGGETGVLPSSPNPRRLGKERGNSSGGLRNRPCYRANSLDGNGRIERPNGQNGKEGSALRVTKIGNSKIKIVIILTLYFGVLLFTKAVYAHEAGWWSMIDRPGDLAEYADYGTTLMLPYNGAWTPYKIPVYLDEAAQLNIKVWVDLRICPPPNPLLDETSWKKIINDNKKHPALEGWYIADEPELSGTSPSVVSKYYNWTKEADPNHPVAIAHANTPYEGYVNGYDVLIVDYYPGWTLYDPNLFNWMVRASYSRWKAGLEFAQLRGKKFIATGLGFGAYEDGTPNNGTRDLTYEEYRYHTFSAIVQGVDGFLFWEDDWANTRVKPRVAQMISQIHSISAEMKNGITNDPKVTVSQPTSKVVYRHGVNGTQHVILAVNIAGYNVSDDGETLKGVQFTLPTGIQTSQVQVLSENRTLPVIDGVFTDNFNRFEVHAYRFSNGNSDLDPPVPPKGLKVH
ncbi:MAG: hypothetical protein ACFE9C_17720 [Candidatus Hodarchaeota archaeon]